MTTLSGDPGWISRGQLIGSVMELPQQLPFLSHFCSS